MIIEINSISVPLGRGAEFEAAFANAVPLLTAVEGCRDARLLRCFEKPGCYMIQLGWERLEDHVDHYPTTAQAVAVRALLGPMIASADMAHYEAVVES